MKREACTCGVWGVFTTSLLGIMIVVGSRNLAHFDAALIAYTFASLFATFGVTYRYAMWLQRPPTSLYWKRGWQAFLHRRKIVGNTGRLAAPQPTALACSPAVALAPRQAF